MNFSSMFSLREPLSRKTKTYINVGVNGDFGVLYKKVHVSDKMFDING